MHNIRGLQQSPDVRRGPDLPQHPDHRALKSATARWLPANLGELLGVFGQNNSPLHSVLLCLQFCRLPYVYSGIESGSFAVHTVYVLWYALRACVPTFRASDSSPLTSKGSASR